MPLHVAKNAMSQDILDPTGRFLITEATGRQLIYAEKYEEAQPWLDRLVCRRTKPTSGYATVRESS